MNNITHSEYIENISHRDFFAMQCHVAIGFENACRDMNNSEGGTFWTNHTPI